MSDGFLFLAEKNPRARFFVYFSPDFDSIFRTSPLLLELRQGKRDLPVRVASPDRQPSGSRLRLDGFFI